VIVVDCREVHSTRNINARSKLIGEEDRPHSIAILKSKGKVVVLWYVLEVVPNIVEFYY
jgi:hypothetical protein